MKDYSFEKPFRSKISILFVFFIFTWCLNAQQIEMNNEDIQNLVMQLKEQSQVKSLLSTKNVHHIKKLKAYVTKSKSVRKQEEIKEKDSIKNTLGNRYKRGDTSTIPEIVKLLNSKDRRSIFLLFNSLKLEYHQRKTETLKIAPEIRAMLFKLIEEPELESVIVQFLGYNKVEGSLEVFENRLLSENAKEKPRMFYWLAEDGKSEIALEYISDILNNYQDKGDRYWFRSSLRKYLENTSKAKKEIILSAVYNAIKADKITAKDISNISQEPYLRTTLSDNSSEKKSFLYEIITDFGDQRSIPYLEEFRDTLTSYLKENDAENLSDALFEYEYQTLKFKTQDEQEDLLIKALNSPDYFDQAARHILKDEKLIKRPDLIDIIFNTAAKIPFKHYERERFFNALNDFSRDDFLKYVNKTFPKGSHKDNFITHYNVYKETLEAQIEYLNNIGLINFKPTPQDIENFQKSEYYHDFGSSIYSALNLANISFGFDIEPNIVPVDYDVLLGKYIDISKGKLSGIEYYLETKLSEDYESVDYKFYVFANDTCFIMLPQDYGDWYDMETFNLLLGNILNELNISERFIEIYGGQYVEIIFGKTNAVQKLMKKYKLQSD